MAKQQSSKPTNAPNQGTQKPTPPNPPSNVTVRCDKPKGGK